MQLSKLTIISLTLSIIGLVLIYIIAISSPPLQIALNNIDASLVGRTVNTVGYITIASHTNGNLFLTISDNSAKLQVPIFASYIQSTKLDADQYRIGKKVSVTGLVDEYNGQLQVIPQKLGDVVIE